MLAAMGDIVGEKGFLATTVADVIKRAGVSRETFYEHFANKEDCFIAAYDTGVEAMTGEMVAALGSVESADPFERLDHMIGAYLDALMSEPNFARASLVESFAAGEQAITRRAQLLEGFIALVVATLNLTSDEDRFAAEAIVASVSSMVTMRIGSGQIETLPELREPIVALARRVLEK